MKTCPLFGFCFLGVFHSFSDDQSKNGYSQTSGPEQKIHSLCPLINSRTNGPHFCLHLKTAASHSARPQPLSQECFHGRQCLALVLVHAPKAPESGLGSAPEPVPGHSRSVSFCPVVGTGSRFSQAVQGRSGYRPSQFAVSGDPS